MAPGRGESEWREEGSHCPLQIEEEATKDGKIRGKEGHKQNTAPRGSRVGGNSSVGKRDSKMRKLL